MGYIWNMTADETKRVPDIRVHMNIAYLHITFTVFILLITLAPELLGDKPILSIQIVLAIPLLFSSIFARSRSVYIGKDTVVWNTYGFICFLIAYALLVNSVGILLSIFANHNTASIFLLANILLAGIYSLLEVREKKERLKERVWKDGLFVIILILLGLFPVLGVY
ncbi:hypothetical protein C4544_07210 [candidate division WS5 bacterium]|uniref:Uncharacterized protein n=1 Tax=candidate division WS5 bacterium TaxID=2093353 RepID=A0A419DAI8_9BACT|nr:MAG: hypothetical protein C4544_07210 [candidate division WS5 bacterium]